MAPLSSEPEHQNSSRKNRFADVLFFGLIVFMGIRIVDLADTRGFENDFAHYYVSSKAFLSGNSDIYRIDLGPEYERLNWTKMDEPVFRASNPPALLIFFCAFAVFPPNIAFWLWVTLQIVCLVLIYCICKRLIGNRLSDDQYKMVISAFLVLPILEAHFHYSQVQLLLLVLVLWAYDLSKRGNFLSSCLLICVASLLKIFPLVLLPWFVWNCGRRASQRVRIGVASAAMLLAGLIATGPYLWIDFFETASKGISVWAKSFPSYSICSFFSKFGIIISGSNGSALTNTLFSIGLAVSLLMLTLFYVATTGIFGKGRFDDRDKDVEFSTLLVLMLLCGTTCWLHYLVFIFFPVCIALSKLLEQPDRFKWAIAGSVFLMLHTSLFVSLANGPTKLVVTNLPFIALCILLGFLATILFGSPAVGNKQRFNADALVN